MCIVSMCANIAGTQDRTDDLRMPPRATAAVQPCDKLHSFVDRLARAFERISVGWGRNIALRTQLQDLNIDCHGMRRPKADIVDIVRAKAIPAPPATALISQNKNSHSLNLQSQVPSSRFEMPDSVLIGAMGCAFLYISSYLCV